MPKSLFAEGTLVPVERSRAEIEKIVARAGATRFASGWEEQQRASILFEMKGKRLRFLLPMPSGSEKKFHLDGRGHPRNTESMRKALDAESRRRWRALLLVIRSKLEAVASGMETFEDAFLANIVLPSGDTVGEWAKHQLDAVYQSGRMPPMLGMGDEP